MVKFRKTALIVLYDPPSIKDQGVSKLQIETILVRYIFPNKQMKYILVKQVFYLEFMDPIKLPF